MRFCGNCGRNSAVFGRRSLSDGESNVQRTTPKTVLHHVAICPGVTIYAPPRSAVTSEITKTKPTAKRRRRSLRWIVAVVLGLLLGLLAVLFFRLIYNPFMKSVPDPLVLVPRDVDFVVSVPDFPAFVEDVTNRKFIAALSAHRGFSDFLETPYAKQTGVLDALRSAFLQLNMARGALPFGLDVLGDVSGQHVILAGWVPEAPGKPWRLLVLVRPKSWLTIAGTNVMMQPKLYEWFVKDSIAADVSEVEHFRDAVRIRPKSLGQDIFVTRVADTILVSTEGRLLSQIAKEVTTEGLPADPAPRFRRLIPGFETQVSDTAILCRRAALERQLSVEAKLRELWGPRNLDLAESSLPRVGGDDFLINLKLREGLTISLAGEEGSSKPEDLGGLFQPWNRDSARDAIQRVAAMMPKEAFGFIQVHADLGRLVKVLSQRPEIFSAEDQKQIAEFCASVPAFGSRDGLCAEIDSVTGRELAFVFFRQEREPFVDKAKPGFAIVCPIEDDDRLQRLLRELESLVARKSSNNVLVKDLVRRDVGSGVVVWQPQLAAGVVDDPRVTVPGLILAKDHLLITSYIELAERMAAAIQDPALRMASHPGFARAQSYAPEEMALSGVLDIDALYPYLEQSASGWATSQTRVENRHYVAWHREFRDAGEGRGLDPGTPVYEERLQAFVERKKNDQQIVEFPKQLRRWREHFEHFRGLFGAFGVFAEKSPSGLRFTLRLDVEHE